MSMKQILRKTILARLAMTLCLAMFATNTWAQSGQQFITEVMLIGTKGSDARDYYVGMYTADGWKSTNYDLNAGCGSKSDYIYLLYRSSENTDGQNHGYISRFLIYVGKNCPQTISQGGLSYRLASYDGTDHFSDLKGDLNSNAGGDDIHLYYTKDVPSDGQFVTSIWFDNNSQSSVGTSSTWDNPGVDLNKGCGSSTPYIYMHVSTAKPTAPVPPPHYPTYYDLNKLTSDVVLMEGDIIMGSLASSAKITIADGAMVKLKDVEIQYIVKDKTKWAGITCEGDATILYDGKNMVMGLDPDYPAIYVPQGKTLTLKSSGKGRKFETYSGGFFYRNSTSAAIGAGNGMNCGNIIIDGGQVEAHAYQGAMAIGRGSNTTSGNVTLRWLYDDDYIYLDGGMESSKVRFDSQQKFYLEGTSTEATPNNIAGQTIVPLPTDGVDDLIAEPNVNQPVYTLSGQRVSNPKRGIYIVNGKKVLVK